MTFIPNHPMVPLAASIGSTGSTLFRLGSHGFNDALKRVTSEMQIGGAYHEGEQPLSVVEAQVEPKGKARGYFGGFVVTDRRVYGRGRFANVSDTAFEVWLQQAMTFQADFGLLSGSLNVQTTSGVVPITFLHHPAKKLFEGVMQIAPEHRTMGPAAFGPSPGDDFGAMAASRHAAGAPQAMALFQLADVAARGGRLAPDAARSLLERAILLDRHVVWGRGMHHGQWLSLLPRAVLRDALVSFFGPPAWGGGDAMSDTLDFAIGSGRSNAGLSTALGIASLAVLGVGWISIPGEAPPRFLRFTITDAPCGSAFALGASSGGPVGRVPLSGARIFAALSDQITKLEGRQMLADAMMPEVPPHVRLAQPEAAVADRARQLMGSIDLRAFA